MIDHPTRPGRPARAALYLRCYPCDTAGLDCQRAALERLAVEHGLPAPGLYLDNGHRSGAPLPALERLLREAVQGWVDVVLVPGPFVFALDDRAARATVCRLEALGCEVLELPGRADRAVQADRAAQAERAGLTGRAAWADRADRARPPVPRPAFATCPPARPATRPAPVDARSA
ncbi:hypothetical protein OH807_39260 [Kitasatospora sp. NBC_01560]|uniref:hypothetical protein n=1 Tax=Kitasatospora sp. NBC_01560 TaxID=2975965 RepID=UPI00386EB857